MLYKYPKIALECLTALQLNADIPLSKLSDLSGINLHTLKYWKKKALNDGVLVKRPLINIYNLSKYRLSVRLSINFSDQESRSSFEKTIVEIEEVKVLLRLENSSYYYIYIFASDPYKVVEVISSFSNESNIVDKKIALVNSDTLYRRKLSPNKKFPQLTNFVKMACGNSYKELNDQINKKILSALGQYPHDSTKKLSEKLGISYAKLNTRIANLKKLNIFKGYVYGIRVERLGFKQTRIFLTFKSYNNNSIDKLEEFCHTSKSIIYLQRVFGEWDFEIISEHKSSDEIKSCIEKLNENFGDQILEINHWQQDKYLKCTSA